MNDPPLSHAKGDLHFTFLDDLPLTSAAAEFARRRHVAQHRDSDGAPFIVHPLEVAFELHRSGYPDHVIAAAVLHDVLEDTDTDQPELQLRFGPEVCELVALVSDDPAIADEEERKDDIRDRVRASDGDALVIYAADKISKVRELRGLVVRGLPQRDADTKLRRYEKSLRMLERSRADNRLVELLRFEIEALRNLPPAPGEG